MNEELKPCQCKNSDIKLENVSTISNSRTILYRICCPECGMCTDWDENEENVIKTWNNRPLEDTIQAENNKLKIFAKVVFAHLYGDITKDVCEWRGDHLSLSNISLINEIEQAKGAKK